MSDCGHTPLYSEDFARGGMERMPCYICELSGVSAERDALIVRRDELLAAMVRITRETPYPEEDGNAAVLIAKVGTLKARVAELEAQRDRARAAAQVYVERVDALGLAADDADPLVMATAEPIGAAQADLYAALGLLVRDAAGRVAAVEPSETVEQLRAERDAARMLADVRGRERDALKAECHGRRFDPNLVRDNQQLRDELAEVDSVIGDYDWAAVAEDAHGTDFAAPLEKVARIEKARKEARK